MMIAMMVPSASPMILLFASLQRRRREQRKPFLPTGIFLAGYFVTWTAFSFIASLIQWGLHSAALISPMMISTSPYLGSVLLISAGVFQWTPWKNACLYHCRSPISFLSVHWREEKAGALIMGIHHGTFCVGCCWVLMLLLFVTGVMNLFWVAIIAAFVMVEKVVPSTMAHWVTRVAGVGLVAWAAIILIAAHM
jgi:predicted metal-binding membrane protein